MDSVPFCRSKIQKRSRGIHSSTDFFFFFFLTLIEKQKIRKQNGTNSVVYSQTETRFGFKNLFFESGKMSFP